MHSDIRIYLNSYSTTQLAKGEKGGGATCFGDKDFQRTVNETEEDLYQEDVEEVLGLNPKSGVESKSKKGGGSVLYLGQVQAKVLGLGFTTMVHNQEVMTDLMVPRLLTLTILHSFASCMTRSPKMRFVTPTFLPPPHLYSVQTKMVEGHQDVAQELRKTRTMAAGTVATRL